MRIIDKKGKDYYDGVILSLYRDDGLTFVRKYEEEYLPREPFSNLDFSGVPWSLGEMKPKWPFGKNVRLPWIKNRSGKQIETEILYIGFCGRVYLCISIRHLYETEETVYCHTYEETIAAIAKYNEQSVPMVESSGKSVIDLKRAFDAFDNPPGEYAKRWQEMMIAKRSPIFIARRYYGDMQIAWNPKLQDYKFFRTVDPNIAAQQIFQFFSSLASPEIEAPAIDDKTMAEIKGHGDRYSFRKPPGTKTRKGKRKSKSQ